MAMISGMENAATPHTKEHYEIKNERKMNPSSELYI